MKFFRVMSMRVARYGALTLLIGALGSQALAQDEDDEEAVEEIVVTGSLKAMPTQDVGSVFGFDKTILETSRSVSTISSEQIARFDMDEGCLAVGTDLMIEVTKRFLDAS